MCINLRLWIRYSCSIYRPANKHSLWEELKVISKSMFVCFSALQATEALSTFLFGRFCEVCGWSLRLRSAPGLHESTTSHIRRDHASGCDKGGRAPSLSVLINCTDTLGFPFKNC